MQLICYYTKLSILSFPLNTIFLFQANAPVMVSSGNSPYPMYSSMQGAPFMPSLYSNVLMPCCQCLSPPKSSSYLYQFDVDTSSCRICNISSSTVSVNANSNVSFELPSLLSTLHIDTTREAYDQNLKSSSLAINSSTSMVCNAPTPIVEKLVKTNNFSSIRAFVMQETGKASTSQCLT